MLPVSTEQKLELVALKIFCRVNRIGITDGAGVCVQGVGGT